jgi:hypothetical protein
MANDSASDTAAIKAMILEVLEAHEHGLMLVPLREAVNAQLVNQQILPQGCSHDQVRYALRWLIEHTFVCAKPSDGQQGNHYTYYFIKGSELLRNDAPKKPAGKTVEMPTRRLSPMASIIHSLSQIPTTWDPTQDIAKD